MRPGAAFFSLFLLLCIRKELQEAAGHGEPNRASQFFCVNEMNCRISLLT